MKVRVNTDFYDPMLISGKSYDVKNDFIAPSPFEGGPESEHFFKVTDEFGDEWDIPSDCVDLV